MSANINLTVESTLLATGSASVTAAVGLVKAFISQRRELREQAAEPGQTEAPELIPDLAVRVRKANETARKSFTDVGEALAANAALFYELEAELKARTAALDALAAEAEAAELRANEARSRAAIGEKAAQAVDAYLERALERRIAEQERAGHRWDVKILIWSVVLSGVVGLTVGVAAIPVWDWLHG